MKKLGKFVNCEICQKEIYINPSRLKNKHHTCSRKCAGILASRLHSQKVKVNCAVCAREIFYKKSAISKIANPTCSSKCRSELLKKIYKGSNNPKFKNKSYEESYFHERCADYRRRAYDKGMPFDLDSGFLSDLYKRQDGKCFYSKLEMKFHSDKNRKNSAASYNVASLDRLDSNKGYTKDNVVWCLNCINMLKAHHALEDIKVVMKAIMLAERTRIEVKVKKLYSDAREPISNSIFNSGYDVFTHRVEEYESYYKVYSGIAIQPISNYYFILAPRSSIYKSGLIMHNSLGIIDKNYTGEIIGIFYKTENHTVPKVGDRLMQLIPQELQTCSFNVVAEFEETDRNEAGFGSSGA